VSTGESALPKADVQPVPRHTWAWILPVLAVALAVFLVLQAAGRRGARVLVRAPEGHGIGAGDSLRYRGIDVGEIEAVRLSDDLSDVELVVRLEPGAEDLARAGSRFWVVRPHLSLDGVQGLETVVGARYLAVLPGPSDARRCSEFVALSEPPVAEELEEGGLEITLEASTRFGLAPGAPLSYRGIQVGTVLSVGLSSDATAVEVRAWIRPAFVPLVRRNTRFWETGGLELAITLLGGLRLDFDSVRSMLVGGIALATPPDAGDGVTTGQRFPLVAEPRPEWLEWSVPLPVGALALPSDARLPRLLRAKLRWSQGRLIARRRERAGWVLPVAGGLRGPADLLRASPEAKEGSAELEVAGTVHPLAAPVWEAGGVVEVAIEVPGAQPFDQASIRTMAEAEDCLVLEDPARPPMALAARRLLAVDGGFEVDPAMSLDESWHGAAVLARGDGALVGLLLVEGGRARIAPLK